MAAIKSKTREAFQQSQAIVPVRTGNLKASGSQTEVPQGANISYSAEYSSFIERGFKGGSIHVNSYVRKDGTRVKSYDYYSPPREGRHYIEKPLKGSFDTLAQELDRQLRMRFKNVVRV